jgi:hypothetical protein
MRACEYCALGFFNAGRADHPLKPVSAGGYQARLYRTFSIPCMDMVISSCIHTANGDPGVRLTRERFWSSDACEGPRRAR